MSHPVTIGVLPIGAALTAIETGSKIAVPKRAAASIKKSKFDSSSPVLIQNPNFLAAKAQALQSLHKSKMTAGSKAAPATVPTGNQACCNSPLQLNQPQNLQHPERSQLKAKQRRVAILSLASLTTMIVQMLPRLLWFQTNKGFCS